MSRIWRVASIGAILLAAAGCGSSTTGPSGGSLHSEVSDSKGDALPDPGVPVSPDLVHGTVDVSGGNITVTIQFAPGTLDRATSRVTIELDTDQNATTGIRTTNGLGVDYVVDFSASADQAAILKAVPTTTCTATDPCYMQVGVAPLSLLADGVVVTAPLSLIGSADGRSSFRILAYVSRAAGALPVIVADVMPDITLAPAHVP